MASDMVERVARALCFWDGPDGCGCSGRCEREIEQTNIWLSAARTAIEAMREPTEAMESAFFDAHAESETFFADARGCWQSMIDAALQESSHVR